MATEMQKYIDAMQRNTGMNFESFEAQATESFELENFAKQKLGKSPLQAKIFASQIQSLPPAQKKEAMKEIQENTTMKIGVEGERVAGNFNIVIVRNSIEIDQDLPFAIFGASAKNSGYIRVLNEFLPQGVTMAVSYGVNAGKPNSLVFTFTDTATTKTDTITVTCNETSYVELLENMMTDKFVISETKYFIADTSTNGLKQLNRDFGYKIVKTLGKTEQDTIPLKTQKSFFQNQNDGVNITGVFPVNKFFTFYGKLQKEVAQEITLSFNLSLLAAG